MSNGQSMGKLKTGFIGLNIVAFLTIFLVSSVGVYAYSAASTFNALEQVGLIFTLETVARTVMIPMAGSIGDRYGRKRVFLFALAGYILAYAVGAFAQNFWTFVIARTITGLFWGLFQLNLFVMISDIFGQDIAPKYSGITQTFTTIAMVAAAPVVGVVCALNWRLEFYIALPILAVAWVLCYIGVPGDSKSESSSTKVDVTGCIATVLTLIPFTLAMNWANTYGWTSALILILFAVTLLGIIVLVAAERKAVNPVYPVRLLKNRSFLIFFIIAMCFNFSSGAAMYGQTIAQSVMGISSSLTGIMTLPGMLISIIITPIMGNYVAKTGKYKKLAMLWCILHLAASIIFLFVNPCLASGAMLAFVILVIATTVYGPTNAFQQIIPYTYPMKVLRSEDLATGMAFLGIAGPLGTAIASGLCGALMNAPGGMGNLLYVPIFPAVIMMLIVFKFRDIGGGQTV